MASTYTNELRLEQMATGENDATWGTKLNTVIGLIEDSISGMATVAVTGGAYSLTTQNSVADEARVAILKFTGTLTSNSTVTIPDKTKSYIVWNATSGAFTLTLKPSGTGVAVTQGVKTLVFCDGTDCFTTHSNLAYLDGVTSALQTQLDAKAPIASPSFTGTVSAAGLMNLSGASAGQIKFPSAQNASADANTLDDYEEGTWTPAYSPGSGVFGSITYSQQLGTYTKIGRQVTAVAIITTSAITVGTASGGVNISGLPFPASATFPYAGTVGYSASWVANPPLACYVDAAASAITLLYNTSGYNSATQVSNMDTGSGKNGLRVSVTYFV